MTTSSAPSSVSVGRPPAPVIGAVIIVGIRMLFGAFGFVFFGVFVGPEVNPQAGSPSAVAFTAVGLVYVITALASLPGLWRGRRLSWHLLTCVLAALVLFGCYKIFAESEADSVIFLVVDLVSAALLLLPAARRHLSS